MKHKKVSDRLDKQLLDLAVAIGNEFEELCDEDEMAGGNFSTETLAMEHFMEQIDLVVVDRGLEDRFLELV